MADDVIFSRQNAVKHTSQEMNWDNNNLSGSGLLSS